MNDSLARCLLLPSLFAFAPFAHAEALPAQVHYAERIEMGAAVGGVVASVTVEPGDVVKKGEVLLTLDPAPFQAAVQEAQAVLTRREVVQQRAMRDYRQAQELYDRTVLSTMGLQDAEMQASDAYAALLAARAALTQAQYRLQESVLRAPFDGVVLARSAEPGQAIAGREGATLLTLALRGEYLAVATIPPARLASLAPGTRTHIAVGGATYTGTIQASDPSSPSDCAGPPALRVLFQTPSALQAGQPATIELP